MTVIRLPRSPRKWSWWAQSFERMLVSNYAPEPLNAAKICSGSCPCSCSSSPCVCECPRMECEWAWWSSSLLEVAECSDPFSSLFFLFTALPWGFFVEWDRICCMLERRSCVGRSLNLFAKAFGHDIRRIRLLDIVLPLTKGGEMKPRPIICLNILSRLQEGKSRTSIDPNNSFMTCEVSKETRLMTISRSLISPWWT